MNIDYEKAYKEARERAKAFLGKGFRGEDLLVECVFPELKESEDEKVRKALLRCCDDWEKGQFGCMAKEDVPAIRAYLERQKEQQPAVEQLHGTFTSYDMAKTFTEGQHYVMEHPEKFGLCKPVEWSEEDEEMLRIIINRVEKFNEWATEQGYLIDDPTMKQSPIDWLKSLRPQPHWKPSEEQLLALKEQTSWLSKANPLHSLYYQLCEL